MLKSIKSILGKIYGESCLIVVSEICVKEMKI